ncbi:C4-dicarboxylate ABC transporter (plasmid) [Paroceanicella profunda]|uniref:C4-dicarboxylate ABC transporter n=1 Tax=Paroceanicella profunda TaxID=2579971 RepID=A0A5B8G4K5_9RHOB|nr:TDT family transporter [Paroceanicella profunda]QDL94379.1 C4-dicarboxylate ABC transporter [Paroceanicella profunda]
MTRFALAAARLRPFSALEHPREVIRQFTPNWFAVTMGTGVVALALPQIPGAGPALMPVAEAIWQADIGLFTLFALLYALRWILFPQEARRIFGHGVVSMFLGTIPMGFATLINGLIVFGLPRWGAQVVPLAEALWWLDAAMALACGVGVPFLMFSRQEHRFDTMTAVWLLPVVAAEVAAASGGLIAPHLADPASAYAMLVASYALWACSVPVAFAMITMLMLRMALHKLPDESMAATSWLALGPIGTGALGMLVLGADAPAIFAAQGLAGVGEIASGLGVLLGLVLWGFGMWWFLLATLITCHHLRRGIPFNLGAWGYTFPIGVYTLATFRLGDTLGLAVFDLAGTVLATGLTLLWLWVAGQTLRGGWCGRLFVSPCIAGLRRG